MLRVLPAGLRRQKLLTMLYRLRLVSPVQALRFNGNAKAWVDLRDAESRATYLAQSFWPEFPPMVFVAQVPLPQRYLICSKTLASTSTLLECGTTKIPTAYSGTVSK